MTYSDVRHKKKNKAMAALTGSGLLQCVAGQVLRLSPAINHACFKAAFRHRRTQRSTKPSLSTRLCTSTFSSSATLNGVTFCKTVNDALSGLEDGMTIMTGGIGMCGAPENLIQGVVDLNVKDLKVISIDFGSDDFGLGLLLPKMQVREIIASHIGENRALCRLFLKGQVTIELVPHGTLAERVRAGGAGVAAFYTHTGYGTMVEQGSIPLQYHSDGSVLRGSTGREVRQFNGFNFILEEALKGDVALIKAWKSDKLGNLSFRKVARNINPTMARACRMTVAEVEEVVPVGHIPPEDVHLPHIYVDRVIHVHNFQKRIARPRFSDDCETQTCDAAPTTVAIREVIARRVAAEFKDGMYVSLGVGIPEIASNFTPPGTTVHIMCENGSLGLGPYPNRGQEDADLINTNKEPITLMPGGSCFSTDDSFALIRGNHLDLTVLGGMQVSRFGDLANWMIPGELLKGMGGAMDLVGAEHTRCAVAMTHCSYDDKPKIVAECLLPLTGKECVDMIITEKAVFDVHRKEGLTLKEIAPGETEESLRKVTGCDFKVSPDLLPIQQCPSLTRFLPKNLPEPKYPPAK